MLELLNSIANNDAYGPFVFSIYVMLTIAAIEVITALCGLGLFSFFDTLLPEFDVDLDADADINFGHSILGWLNFGEVPLLVILVILFTSFGIIGISAQMLLASLWVAWNPWLLSILIFFLALFPVHIVGGWIAKIIPQQETMSVSSDSFAGKIAVIETGDARRGVPAEALLQDDYGKDHRVLVEPLEDKDVYKRGSKVVIIERDENTDYIFKCVPMEEF